ncbi:hypothetical protein V1527DRAFT_476253 [Lipomyces starkeyi]
MLHLFPAMVGGGYFRKSRIFPIIITLLYLLEIVSAYERGRLCVSAVYHTYDIYMNGDLNPVVEETGLFVYQEGVDITTVIGPGLLLIDDLTGSAKVPTSFKVGTHFCTLYGDWKSGNNYPPLVPSISTIKCGGTNRIWSITSSDAGYFKFFQIGSNSGPPEYRYMNAYSVFGKYCGAY